MRRAGERAPDVSLCDTSGEPVSLDALLSGGPAVLAFFKTSCPVCQMIFPYLDRLAQAGSPEGLRIIGVSQDAAAVTRAFQKQFGSAPQSLIDGEDEGYQVSNAYGITHVPSLFVIERDGRISHSWSGFSKADLQSLGDRFHVPTFEPDESVPAFKPG